MIVIEFLALLKGIRKTAKGWQARCPGPLHEHGDRSPSLSVGEGDDGRILLHCHAGCSVQEVVGAMGVELCELFPVRTKPIRGRHLSRSPRDLLRMIGHEVTVVSIAAHRFETLTADDLDRVKIAGQRIRAALEVADVR